MALSLSHPLKSHLIGKLIGPYCIIDLLLAFRKLGPHFSSFLGYKLTKYSKKENKIFHNVINIYECEAHENIFPHDKMNKESLATKSKKKKQNQIRMT